MAAAEFGLPHYGMHKFEGFIFCKRPVRRELLHQLGSNNSHIKFRLR